MTVTSSFPAAPDTGPAPVGRSAATDGGVDRLVAIADLGALAAAASQSGDVATAAKLRHALEALVEAHAEATANERRRSKDRTRKRRRLTDSADATDSTDSVEFRESRGSRRTPSPSSFPPYPPNNSPSPESENASAARAAIRDAVGAEWPDIEAFLTSRTASKRERWLVEMAKILGAGSHFAGADLAGACRDALTTDTPIAGPHALRAFVVKQREERLAAKRRLAGSAQFGNRSAGGHTNGIASRAFVTAMEALVGAGADTSTTGGAA